MERAYRISQETGRIIFVISHPAHMAEAVHGAAATATADAAEAEAPPVAVEAEPCIKKAQRGAKGMPPHVIESKLASGVTKYQARLRWLPLGANMKKRYDPIPGENGTTYFATPEDAAAAQAAAQQLLDSAAGAQAVWPDGLPGEKARAVRGTAPPRSKGIRKSKAEKAPGIGRGNNKASHGNKPRKQDKQSGSLGQTVPLPAHRCTACQHCIVDYLSEKCAMCAAPTELPEVAGAAGSVSVLPPVPVALAPES